MKADTKLSILHLTTHLDIGGITRYLGVLTGEMAKRGHRISIASSGGALTADLEKKGVSCHAFPIRVKSELHPKLFSALPGIETLIARENFDAIHAHTRVTQVAAWLIARKRPIPVVTTAHGFFRPNLGRKIFPCWGDRAIAISAPVGEELERTHGVQRERIRVIHNALDVDDFERRLSGKHRKEVRAKYDIPADALVLGCVARFVKDKGHDYLLRAAGLLSAEADVHLILVGDGREKEALERLSKALGLSGRTHFLAGEQDISSALCAMDIFVHPATYREGFGLSIAEALLAGKPVIATDIPAVGTIVKNGVNGLLVPPKNAAAIAEGVRYFRNNPEKAKSFAEAGKNSIRKMCAPEKMADEVEAVYREAMGEVRG